MQIQHTVVDENCMVFQSFSEGITLCYVYGIWMCWCCWIGCECMRAHNTRTPNTDIGQWTHIPRIFHQLHTFRLCIQCFIRRQRTMYIIEYGWARTIPHIDYAIIWPSFGMLHIIFFLFNFVVVFLSFGCCCYCYCCMYSKVPRISVTWFTCACRNVLCDCDMRWSRVLYPCRRRSVHTDEMYHFILMRWPIFSNTITCIFFVECEHWDGWIECC